MRQSTPGEIELDTLNVTILHNGRLAHITFQLGTFTFQQVTTTGFGALDFTSCRDFESLGNRLFSFTTSNGFRHGSGTLAKRILYDKG